MSGEVDLRRYVVECLRARADVRVFHVATTAVGRQLVVESTPALIIIDERAAEVVYERSECRAILLVNELPREDARHGSRVRFLARRIAARELRAAVSPLIG